MHLSQCTTSLLTSPTVSHYFCGMVQNSTEAIQDRKTNQIDLNFSHHWTFIYLFFKVRIPKSSDDRKKLCLFPCTCIFILRQYIVLPITKNGKVLHSEYLWKLMTVILTLAEESLAPYSVCEK